MVHNVDHMNTLDQNVQRLVDANISLVSQGNDHKQSIVHKFGAGTVGTTIGPITQTGAYKTPIAASYLEFVSASAADGSAGSGAREVTVQGLDTDWVEVTQTVVTDGQTPVVLAIPLKRMYRWYVSLSGSYAESTTGSHVGSLTLRDSGGGGDDWDVIPATPFPAGQSQIGVYTIPLGKTGWLLGKIVFVDTNTVADIYMFQRPLANDTTSPYTSIMKMFEREIGVKGGFDHHFASPKGPFVGPCDIGVMGVVGASTADVSVEFELLLIDT